MNIAYLSRGNVNGSPPLIEVTGITTARVLARCEGHNEYGSIKSRMVRYLLLKAMRERSLQKGDWVIEASSGNTGMALAGIGAELGLKILIVLLDGTDTQIVERLKALGAELHFCDRPSGMRGMLTFIKSHYPDVFSIDQFRNKAIVPAYVQTHEQELLTQLAAVDFIPDYLFACVGTGGTLQGMGTILRKRWSSIRIIAVEKESAAAPIDGIRNTEVAYFGDADIYDKGFPNETVYIGECLTIPEGLTASPSCGALLEAIRRYPAKPNSNVLAIFCDAQLRDFHQGQQTWVT
jgi:cysteine synthase